MCAHPLADEITTQAGGCVSSKDLTTGVGVSVWALGARMCRSTCAMPSRYGCIAILCEIFSECLYSVVLPFVFLFLFSCFVVVLFSTHTSVFIAEDRASRERAFILQPHNALNLERISRTFRCAVVDDPNSEKSLDPTEYAEFASAPFSGCYSSLWSYLEKPHGIQIQLCLVQNNYAWFKYLNV